jgi:two-component system cell cycle sensor histidine kinase/response regulator CckA
MGTDGGLVTLRTEAVTWTLHSVERGLVHDLQPGSYVVVEVADDGLGMNLDTTARMFDPFFTTKEDGRGLGLSASLGIVQGYGGGVSVQSEAGAGTRVRLFLPTGPFVPPPTKQLPRETPNMQGKRVLIVDDEVGVREIARELLAAVGATSYEAGDGAAAVDILATDAAFDLVLMDLTTPTISGREALQKSRETEPDLPVVIMSGYSDADMTDQLDGLEARAMLHKPFTLETLRGRLLEVSRD